MRSAVFIVIAITLNVALGMTFRHKRQSPDDQENNLDDRYGWDRPRPSGGERPWNRPNQGNNRPRPRPNQGGNQWDQNNQGGNQWDQNNQGGNGWEQNNQGGNQNGNGQNNNNGQPRPTPAPDSTGSTTQSDAVQTCIRNCPVTSEYNPVCGTNMVLYPNPGRLTCAQNCGVNVSLLRASACPVTTTAAPAA